MGVCEAMMEGCVAAIGVGDVVVELGGFFEVDGGQVGCTVSERHPL